MRDYLSVGLHLNLTMVLPKIQPIGSIKTLIIKSLLGSLNTREIKKEIFNDNYLYENSLVPSLRSISFKLSYWLDL